MKYVLPLSTLLWIASFIVVLTLVLAPTLRAGIKAGVEWLRAEAWAVTILAALLGSLVLIAAK